MTLNEKVEKLAQEIRTNKILHPRFARKYVNYAACREYSGILRGMLHMEYLSPSAVEYITEDLIDTWKETLKA